MPPQEMTKKEKIDLAEDYKAFLRSDTGKELMAILEIKFNLTVMDMQNPTKCNSLQLLGYYQGKMNGIKELETHMRNKIGEAKRLAVELAKKE